MSTELGAQGAFQRPIGENGLVAGDGRGGQPAPVAADRRRRPPVVGRGQLAHGRVQLREHGSVDPCVELRRRIGPKAGDGDPVVGARGHGRDVGSEDRLGGERDSADRRGGIEGQHHLSGVTAKPACLGHELASGE